MVKWFWFPLLLLAGCSFFEKKQESTKQAVDPKAVEELGRGVDLLGEERYREASDVFEKLLTEKHSPELDSVLSFNAGAALEGMRECGKARERYRRVILANQKANPQVLAQALHRLGLVYECLNDDARAVTNFLDAHKRKKNLPPEIGQAEVPARLAAAYARLGNKEMAQKYYLEAEAGVKKLQVELRETKSYRDLLARTLFFMGKIDEQKEGREGLAERAMSLRLLQRFLVQSVSLDSREWSGKAKDQLVEAYGALTRDIQNFTVPKPQTPIAQKRQTKEELSRIYQLMMANLKELKLLRFPDPKEPPVIASLYNEMQMVERKLEILAAENAVEMEQTDESRKREGLRREVR